MHRSIVAAGVVLLSLTTNVFAQQPKAVSAQDAEKIAQQQEDEYALRFAQAAQSIAVACKKAGGKRVESVLVFMPQPNGGLQAVVGASCGYDLKELFKKVKK